MTRKAEDVDRDPRSVVREESIDNSRERVVVDIDRANGSQYCRWTAGIQRVDDVNDPRIGSPKRKKKSDLRRNRPARHLRGPGIQPCCVGGHPGRPSHSQPAQLVGATEKAADFGEVLPRRHLSSRDAHVFRELAGSGQTLDAREAEVSQDLPNRVTL